MKTMKTMETTTLTKTTALTKTENDGDDENEVEDDSGEDDDRPPTASATKKMTMIKITRTTTDESTKQSIGTKVWDPVVFPRRDLGAGLL